ncbi:SatD family protein [Longimicrobium sp.]|uniref:SatD family protein n=1 Tax=Longimicrobium sp. TaxID=2029185 RepID=UPI003B3AACB6
MIGDIVQSRRIKDRSAVQDDLHDLINDLNTTLAPHLLAPFRISRGDEIQAIFGRAVAIPDLMWHAMTHFAHPIRFGFGLGGLSTRLGDDPRQTDGPAWWNARDAVQSSVQTKRTGGVLVGFGDPDDLALTAFATVLNHMRGRLTERQLAVISLLRSGLDMVGVAQRLQITKQAVSRIAGAAGWRPYQEGEMAWRALLARHDYSSEWNHARL